jgi:hypothetical protein
MIAGRHAGKSATLLGHAWVPQQRIDFSPCLDGVSDRLAEFPQDLDGTSQFHSARHSR